MNQANSQANGDDSALQVDYSENANLMNQNEVQSAHWCHGQATVITAFVWISEHITDELQHTKLSVFTFMDAPLFIDLKTKYPAIKKLSIFSDGASSQFKNRSSYSQIFICGKTSIM